LLPALLYGQGEQSNHTAPPIFWRGFISGGYMTCKEVAARFGTAEITVRKWAAGNGVAYVGEGVRKTYQWSEDDCKRFSERESPGWKKGQSRKKNEDIPADNQSNQITEELI